MVKQYCLGAAFAVACVFLQGFVSSRVHAQDRTPIPFPVRTGALCSTKVELPAAPAAGAPAAAPAPAAAAAPPAVGQPTLVKVRDDVYVIQNPASTLAEIGPLGGNVTVYLTNDGVVLIDSKNDRMHDDIVAKVRSLTDKPIKYVVLTHNHNDHSGGSAKMQAMGATVVSSEETREKMQRRNQTGIPTEVYKDTKKFSVGGKEVWLREFCGHTEGDTIAYLPAARVVAVGDLVTTPDAIPAIVNYGDGGNWTDLLDTLDVIANIDFDYLVGGHGPVLTTLEFFKYRDRVASIRERLRELNRKDKSKEEITETLLKEYNYGTGPAAAQIPLMMIELKGPRTPGVPDR